MLLAVLGTTDTAPPPPWLRLVTLSILVELLFAGPTVAAAQRRVIPEGFESRVAALVLRGEGGALSIPVTGVQIESQRIVVSLGEVATVGLSAPGTTQDGQALGRSASFSFWLLTGAERADARRAASELRRRVSARDDGTFWDDAIVLSGGHEATRREATSGRHQVSDSGDVSGRRSIAAARRAASWIMLAACLGWLLYTRRGQIRSSPVILSTATFLVALGIRLTLPPWAPLHANDHGISELRGLAGQLYGARPHGADLYGEAYGELVRFLVGPTGLGADGVLLLGAIFGAAGVPLLYGLARQLVPERPGAGVLAATALALHPAHVRLSLSESPRPLAMSLLILGLWLGVQAFRSRDSRVAAVAWLAGALAVALAAELRVMTLLFPLVALAFVGIAAWRRPSAIPWPATLIALGLLVWTLHDHTAALLPALSAGERRVTHLGMLWRPPDLLRPDLSAIALVPLALIGAGLLVRDGERRVVAACVVALAVLVPSGALIVACRTDWIRYQTDGHLPLMLLAAGLAAPASLRTRRWSVPAAALALVLTSAPGLIDLLHPDVHAQAYGVARLAPNGIDIIAGSVEMASEPKVRADFPDYLLEDPSRVRVAPREGAACVIWIGVGCWSFTRDEVAQRPPSVEGFGPFRSECVARLGGVEAARAALRRLPTLDVPHRDQEFLRIEARAPRVGFVPCLRGGLDGRSSNADVTTEVTRLTHRTTRRPLDGEVWATAPPARQLHRARRP